MSKRILFNTPSRAVILRANNLVDDMILTATEFNPETLIAEDDEAITFEKCEFIMRLFFKFGRKYFGVVHHNKKGYYVTCEVLNSPGAGKNKLYVYLRETDNTYELYSYMRISSHRNYVSSKIGIFGVIGFLTIVLMLGVMGAFECDTITFGQALQKLAFLVPIAIGSFWVENCINPFKMVELDNDDDSN